MSSTSRNNSVNYLMGFSVHQPTIGSPLQFFPAMGSQQLDEMIDAYVPGDATILDKRAAVSMEFFEHTMATNELFKFFMVYPTLGSTNTSPTMDSGYHSGFTTSPVMSEGQWNSYSSQMLSPSSSKNSNPDFSNLPGMKIMTKDGRDVTNSASRGCKTKEQRDHAHLMRIMKACESCKKKKTKCDPSHKRSAASTSSGKITKKASKAPRLAAAPPQIAAKQASTATEFDQILSGSSSSLDSFFTESLNAPSDAFSTEWDQFIQYDEEPTESIPYDYDFFLDPAGFFSPSTTASFPSSSTSPSQLPITPIDRDVNITDDIPEGHDHKPILPYLNPGGVEAGSNYVDFNLYSPQSSFLDEDLELVKEVAASPIQSQRLHRHRRRRTDARQEAANSMPGFEFSNALDDDGTYSYQHNVISDAVGNGLFHDTSNYMHQWSEGTTMVDATSRGGVHDSPHASIVSDSQAESSYSPVNAGPAGLSMVDNVLESVTSEGLYGRETIYRQTPSRPLSDRGSLQSPTVLSTAEYGTERLRGRRVVPQGGWISHSSSVSAITPTESPSSQPYVLRSCGQDDLSSTIPSVKNCASTSTTRSGIIIQATIGNKAMGAIRNITPSTPSLELQVSQHTLPNIRRAATAQTSVWRVPSPQASPSQLPSPVTAASSRNTNSLTSELSSRATSKVKQQMTRALVFVDAQHSVADRGSAGAWNSGGEFQYLTGAGQSFPAMGNQSVFSDTLPMISVIAGLGAFSLIASLSSCHTTIVKGNRLIKGVQSAVSGRVARCITAMLLLSIALCAPSPLISFLSMSALPIVAGCIQPQQHTSSPTASPPSSNAPHSHTLPYTSQPRIDLVDKFEATYTTIVRMVRCDLARKLKFEETLRPRRLLSHQTAHV
ncbi:hypothetical protein E0Z10_g10485 [Xylaria hypoxylon]|uniref:Uncharacterized protein n=1 Tax=Xylaria hypoxylon TaxID=37992 RepID=A0A4Z0YEF5_9PEZI|nr:hypothetical protein E0Z10_g10485 [Xylaria hypoxylon]